MITRENKEKQVQDLSRYIGESKASFLLHFQGLNVDQINQLRKELRTEQSAEMKVFRNTLIQKALEQNHPQVVDHFKPHLTGSSAFVFTTNNPSGTAKILSRYVKETECLQIKVGVMEGQAINKEDIEILAKLPSLEVLKAQFLGLLTAPLSGLLGTLSAVPAGLLQLVSAYKDKQETQKK